MIEQLRITVLADNYVAGLHVLAEHGLSMLIEADKWRILFDTGQGKVLKENAETLGIPLGGLDAVVLSHGHYDHTGGVEILLRECSPSAIFVHPAALQPKYAKSDNPPHRFIGIPEGSRQAVRAVQARVVWTETATEIVPGMWCTGEIPRVPANGPGESGFFLDGDCRHADPLIDDQALFIETRNGLVVLAGCAHAGLANTLDRVCALTGRTEVFGIVGGLHLWRATQQQLAASAEAISGRKPRILAPCHCTGLEAHSYLRTRFNPLVRDVGVGVRLEFTES
jgi:7,8-dihydropterin-6-yl-methyl-4-(beta-D-ribofuranosyl)aminobenzene 5'-phosphate synthase